MGAEAGLTLRQIMGGRGEVLKREIMNFLHIWQEVVLTVGKIKETQEYLYSGIGNQVYV